MNFYNLLYIIQHFDIAIIKTKPILVLRLTKYPHHDLYHFYHCFRPNILYKLNEEIFVMETNLFERHKNKIERMYKYYSRVHKEQLVVIVRCLAFYLFLFSCLNEKHVFTSISTLQYLFLPYK